MKDQRGFLLAEETLKIIVAVICILFLAYLLISLYLKSSENKEMAFAKSSLESLVNGVNVDAKEVQISNPSSSSLTPGGWILISFPISESIRPNSCSNMNWQNCICICKRVVYTIRNTGIAEDCDSKGVCLESNLIIKEIKLSNPPISLSIQNGEIIRK